MSHSEPFMKPLKRELSISNKVPFTHLNSPIIFESSNGMLGMVIKIEGVTFETEQEHVVNQNKLTWHRALTALDERFCIYVTVHRHKENTVLEGKFDNSFASLLNEKYHSQFKDRPMFVNEIYLTLIYKGITTGKMGKGISFFNKLISKAITNSREVFRREQMKALENAGNQLVTMLSSFRPRILGLNDKEVGYSELLRFLALFTNGEIDFNFKDIFSSPIAKNILDIPKMLKLYPYGNLAQYISTKQLFFGRYIQFQGGTEEETQFGAIVTIKNYSVDSSSIMLDPLLRLDCDFISTHSYAIESKEEALKLINRHSIKMYNVNDPAVSQIEELDDLRDQLASGLVSMGYHHNTVLLLSKEQLALEKMVSKAIKTYADAGIVAVRETLGQEAAFWAQCPTNIKFIARSSLITSNNFTDFASFHNYRTGYRDRNHLGGAVTLLETPSLTPFFFNFHVRGKKEDPSKGHTIIIGGTNAGKTAFICFMDAQTSRYGGDTHYFDRDRGAEIYIRASGGYYAVLSPEYPNETCFNPFLLSDTPGNRKFLRDLLAQMCKNENEGELEANILEELKRCVDYAYDQLASEHRTLSNATKILSIKFCRWVNLRRWLRASGKYPEGEYAYIYDNFKDNLNLHHKMGYDLTYFLDREPAHIRTAIMMYLCHRIDLSLKGQLVRIYFDEGWQNLNDHYWKIKLQSWIPTLRKKNCFIVIATQSPSSVINSSIRGAILENIATQIFFANPQAVREEYVNGFKLTDSEFESVSQSSPQSRLFLVKQEHDSNLCRLNLGNFPELLAVLSGNTKAVELLDEIRRNVGNDPKSWMPIFLQYRVTL